MFRSRNMFISISVKLLTHNCSISLMSLSSSIDTDTKLSSAFFVNSFCKYDGTSEISCWIFLKKAFYFLWTKLKLIWCIDLVLSNFIDFLDELGRFIGKNRFLRKKKFRRSAVCRDFMAVLTKILSARFLKNAFKLETSPCGSLKELV
jgi:hypothetical protein